MEVEPAVVPVPKVSLQAEQTGESLAARTASCSLSSCSSPSCAVTISLSDCRNVFSFSESSSRRKHFERGSR